MYRYSIYIIKQLGWSTLLVAFTLTGIVWLGQALRFVDFIVNRGVSFINFLHLTALIIPSLLTIVLPFALLCAVLFTYLKLLQDSEIIVLQSAGLSRMQLARPALQFSALVLLFGYFITLYLLPLTYGQFREMQAFLRDNYASLLLQEEVFSNPVEGLTVFIKQRDNNGTLRGILVHDNRNPEQPITMMAQEGRLMQTPQGPRFFLMNGNRQEMQKGRLSVLNFESYTLDISFYTNKAKSRSVQPAEMYLGELLSYDNPDPLEVAEARAEAHQRIIWPLYTVGLTVFALGMLLSQTYNRRMQWARIGIAILLGIAFLATAIALENAASKKPYLISAMYGLLFLLFLVGWVLLTRDTMKRPVLAMEPV